MTARLALAVVVGYVVWQWWTQKPSMSLQTPPTDKVEDRTSLAVPPLHLPGVQMTVQRLFSGGQN